MVHIGAGLLVVWVRSGKLRVQNIKSCEFESCSNGGPIAGWWRKNEA